MFVGRDVGLPFNDDYQPPFPCSAVLRRLVIRSGQPAIRAAPRSGSTWRRIPTDGAATDGAANRRRR